MGELYTDPLCEFLLKFIGETAGGQPEVQHCVGQGAHFLFVKHPGRISDSVTGLKIRLFFFEIVVVLCYHLLDLLPGFGFVFPNGHMLILL